ncbi:ABC transporter permease subunit [Treponema zioleckii]|uniref:ABC transporter permease subunit n=1 Tax=Treponema zioleckii TaxID=331680 RepID=UPI00168B78D9|nr:ABC transporter permease subunit [Treponema zioleckii]
MRFLRFLVKELIFHGIFFAVIGTVALTSLYLLATGADLQGFIDAGLSFLYLISGQVNTNNVGFTSSQIIAAGAAVTLPLTLISLIFLIFISLVLSSYAVSGRYMSLHFGSKRSEYFESFLSLIASMLAAVPLFVGFWFVYAVFAVDGSFIIITLMTVVLGGLSWDATNFLKTDMLSQVNQTHAIVFSTLGRPLGKFFPMPGTYSGYLFQSSLPRYIPYLAGKVPAIIGSITIAEVAFNFPGLGKNLIDALVGTNTDLLVTSVFILLCINAVVSFIVKTILFLIYPRWYEKAI